MNNTLLVDFYTEISSTYSKENQNDFISVIRLNAGHPIYKGHFEQIPITPGVCLTQIIKEILMEKLQVELVMLQGDNIKFLAMINPTETPELNITFSVKSTETDFDVSAVYKQNDTFYVKFKGKFVIVK